MEKRRDFGININDKSGFRFEKLDVWQKAMEWVDSVYLAARNFPPDEKFGLTSQLKDLLYPVFQI